ncbi:MULTISPECIES: FkbM family methyltransferase [unclassified Chelatococcus]|uniref:FkbM family methyltransferase n=1 Tax=unclassified Chelatococcus TaxID=2638111 RepID=UPI00036F80F1|nr:MULTISPECIES: FkbM family methyltransferase [unclassified Chelatococcus]ALA16224.1 FkbM family methyltransferase [Chelatococcus sp. CO-6]
MTISSFNDTEPFGRFAPRSLARTVIEMTRSLPDSWLGKRTAYGLRRLVINHLDGAPVDVETLGARMRLYPYDNVCEKKILFTPQFFDRQERALLAERIGDGFVFMDVGANVGAYSLFVAALAGPRARILAVEPQPDVFERLVFNISLNPFGTIKAVACAVADRAGELTLFLDHENRGESSVKIVGSGTAKSVRVPATTLADLAREEGFERIDAIKLDVEGAEDLILEPFLQHAPPSLFPRLVILEDGSGRWQIDLPALLREKGYKLLAKTRMNFVFERA